MGKDKEKSSKGKKEKDKEARKYYRAQYDALKKERDELQAKLAEYAETATKLSNELGARNQTIADLKNENKAYKRRLFTCKCLAAAAAILAGVLLYISLA
ncbi:hypothetical protein IKW75_01115 [Candidatus Saccharibacteria bacterium]|nr:hypothetical protein [Candidatus Saccharibacteria bacterium]